MTDNLKEFASKVTDFLKQQKQLKAKYKPKQN